jgi:hypothetical protein
MMVFDAATLSSLVCGKGGAVGMFLFKGCCLLMRVDVRRLVLLGRKSNAVLFVAHRMCIF